MEKICAKFIVTEKFHLKVAAIIDGISKNETQQWFEIKLNKLFFVNYLGKPGERVNK